jgi:murein DD-endopeptidase MepM/ murein hydrolase activator NlpD
LAHDWRKKALKPAMRSFLAAVAVLLVSSVGMTAQTAREIVDLALPTDNDALFREDGGPDFYQYVNRDYRGEKSTPWEGGRYGFVRDPLETSAGIVYTRFHEGIDIKPLRRDANGEPLDQVRAIATGKVVHVNLAAGHSNYGRYVVIEHNWGGSNYYSLYGHLSTIAVKSGQRVQKSEPIAVMGYTGVGIDRERAHVHLELNLMLATASKRGTTPFIETIPTTTVSTTGSTSPASTSPAFISLCAKTLRSPSRNFWARRKRFTKWRCRSRGISNWPNPIPG